nr:hypothetical protein [Tanacetum cinerariifolium]
MVRDRTIGLEPIRCHQDCFAQVALEQDELPSSVRLDFRARLNSDQMYSGHLEDSLVFLSRSLPSVDWSMVHLVTRLTWSNFFRLRAKDRCHDEDVIAKFCIPSRWKELSKETSNDSRSSLSRPLPDAVARFLTLSPDRSLWHCFMPTTLSSRFMRMILQEIWCRSVIVSVSSPNEPKSRVKEWEDDEDWLIAQVTPPRVATLITTSDFLSWIPPTQHRFQHSIYKVKGSSSAVLEASNTVGHLLFIVASRDALHH